MTGRPKRRPDPLPKRTDNTAHAWCDYCKWDETGHVPMAVAAHAASHARRTGHTTHVSARISITYNCDGPRWFPDPQVS